MSLLFSIERGTKCKLFVAFMLLVMSAHSQDNTLDVNFEEHCKDSDAYYLHSYKDVTYRLFWSGNKKHVAINTKLVVNNTSGVEKFAFLNLSEDISNNIEKIKIRTLKANGKIIELDSSLVFKRKSKNEKMGSINYPIPGVEPGDTIETAYEYSHYIKDYQRVDFVNLYSNVPSLNTEYTIRTNPELSVRYKTYNGFPKPQVIANDTLLYSVFKMEKIKGVSESEFMCLPCELPYFYYSIEEKDKNVRTWKEVYNEEFNVITQPLSLDFEKSSYYNRWKRRVIDKAADSSKYYQFELLIKEVLENFQIGPIQEEELIKSTGYFLKMERFDPISINRFFRQTLEDMEIDYWAVFARSKQAGEIDPYYIRKGEFDHVFIAYDDGAGSLNFLYPYDVHFKYQINEIPTSIYNTNAVMVKPYLEKKIKRRDRFIDWDLKLAKVDSVNVAVIKLPGYNNLNNIKQIYNCSVDPDESETAFESRFYISGGLSTELRSFLNLMEQNKEMSNFYDAMIEFEGNEDAVQVDSITSSHLSDKKPFNFTLTGKGKLKDALSFVNDSLISISLEKLITHNQIETDSETTELSYYLDYSYSDFLMFIFNFPSNIEIVSSENNQLDLKNEYGEYLFDIKAYNNQITIQSNYKINKDLIPKEDYGQLKEINKAVRQFRNKRLIIKLK